MRIAVIGGGGREHALVWKLKQSPLCKALFCLPGNAGSGLICRNVAIAAHDVAAIVDFALSEKLDLVIIGPEQPLTEGLADKLRAEDIAVVGVSQAAARLEASKAFAKSFCFRYGIPCAHSRDFTSAAEAKAYIKEVGVPIVIKADGLAAGKGVIVAHDLSEALAAVDTIISSFGDSGKTVVVEEFLSGEELSFFALCDGVSALPLLGVRDHKAAYDGNQGPNTGGMGTYASANLADNVLRDKIMRRIAIPTLRGMAAEGAPYSGIMFMGLMIEGGEPKLIEYNVRFGDPECQVLMMLLESDLVELLSAVARGHLSDIDIAWRSGFAVNVVLAAENYPGVPVLGGEVVMPHNLPVGVEIFHAGTKISAADQLVSSGGRVLGVSALGVDLPEARALAYGVMEKISLAGSFYRRDIGFSSVQSP